MKNENRNRSNFKEHYFRIPLFHHSIIPLFLHKTEGGRVIPFFLGGLVKTNGLPKTSIEIPSK